MTPSLANDLFMAILFQNNILYLNFQIHQVPAGLLPHASAALPIAVQQAATLPLSTQRAVQKKRLLLRKE
jgi:hypothetical protein